MADVERLTRVSLNELSIEHGNDLSMTRKFGADMAAKLRAARSPKALVLSAAGPLGEGLCRGLKHAGFDVHATTRDKRAVQPLATIGVEAVLASNCPLFFFNLMTVQLKR